MSFFACAAEKNAASSCEGGRYTPSRRIRWKTRANFSRFERSADSKSVTGPSLKKIIHIEPVTDFESADRSKSVTGPSLKKIVHIEPTRFIVTATLCFNDGPV